MKTMKTMNATRYAPELWGEYCYKRRPLPHEQTLNVAAGTPPTAVSLLVPRRAQRENISHHTPARIRGAVSRPVEPLQHLLDLGVLLLDGRQRLLDLREALGLVGLVGRAGLVLHLPEVLDLLAAVLDLGEAQRGRGALQEVAERRQLGQVSLVAADGGRLARGPPT